MVADTLGRAPSSVDVELLHRAASAAMAPPGDARWFARPVSEGLQFRSVVRDWVDAPAEQAREMRVACGAAICAARLALLVQGREPSVAHPPRPGLLASLSAGAAVEPHDGDRRLYRAIHHGGPADVEPAPAERLRAAMRRTSDVRHAWFRTIGVPAPAVRTALGHPWQDGAEPPVNGLVAVVGAPATDRIADLRVGEAVQHLRLVSLTLGWDLWVLAGPVRRDRARLLGTGMPDGSLVVVGVEPVPGPRTDPSRSGAEHRDGR